jgi:hypothetical protein
MPTVAELAAMSHREVGYVLFLEGCPFAFTDRAELAGSGGSSWIGTGNGARRVLEGLRMPDEIRFATDLETGALSSDDGATFTIDDFDRVMIEWLREQDADEALLVAGRLSPKMDPAPSTLIAADGLSDVDVHDHYINSEAIGGEGERNIFQILPGDPMPGHDHAAYLGEVQDLAPSVVYPAPAFLEGRRASLYLVLRDTSSGAWPGWDDQHEGGGLVWVGTVTEATVQALEWRLRCDGPSSLLRKQLGANRSSEWQPVSSTINLSSTPGPRQDLVMLNFYYWEGGEWNLLLGAHSDYDPVDDVLPSPATAAELRSAINARIAAVSAAAGPDVTWTTEYDAEASLQEGFAQTRVSDSDWAAIWWLGAHERVWAALGYDPVSQAAVNYASNLEIRFEKAEDTGVPPPGPGYWVGTFWTVPVGVQGPVTAGVDADNAGKTRIHRAIGPEGVTQVAPEGGLELRLGIGGASGYVEGQLNRPPPEYTLSNGGGAVDSVGYIALRGSYRESADQDPITMVQVAKVAWRDDDNTIGVDDDGSRVVYLERFIDPRWFGVDRKPLDRTWQALDLEYAWVNFLGYNLDAGDRVDLVLLRTLLSTGTAEWTGYEGQGATRTLGANDHPDAPAPDGSDCEIADLGLAVPADLVDAASFTATAATLPGGGLGSPLARVKLASIGAVDSQEVITRLVEQRGWGLGWVAGRFRLFDRAAVLAPDDVEVTITPDDFAADIDFVEEVDLHPLTPRDRFTVTFGAPLVAEAARDGELRLDARAQDPAARTRRGNNTEDAPGLGLVPYPLWKNVDAPPAWATAWRELVGQRLARWYASPHVTVRVPVQWGKARLIGPGSVVRFSSLFAANREGSYGLSGKVARVVSVTIDPASLVADVELLVQPGDPGSLRRWAPVAALVDEVDTVEERYDAATRTWFCRADAFGRGDGSPDVGWFQEPSWSEIGGAAKVRGWQWDGRRWSPAFSFTVESVDTDAHTITHEAGSFAGTWLDNAPTVLTLAPWDDQPASSWPRALFSVVTRADTKFGAGPTQGFKLLL